MVSAEVEKVRSIWQELLAQLAPPAGIPEWREGFEKLCADFPILQGTSITEVDAGGVPGLMVVAPAATEDQTVLWTHSGGYVFGSAHSYRHFGALLSQATGGRVLLIDYRLAPENTYPAAHDDAKAAYRWLLAQGTDPSTIVLGGDSAGGGLILGTLLGLLDDGDSLPAGGIAVSPVGDLTCSAESMQSRAHLDPIATKDMLQALGGMYAGETDPTSRHLSPALADLTGLPPLLVFVGTDEVLHDDAVTIVANAKQVGVDADLVVGENQFHIWPFFAPILFEGQQAIEQMGDFVRARTRT